MSYPNLYDISWQVDEPTYRQDSAFSYSTLARFDREGFDKIDHLFDRIETPSLTFGSAVDALMTGGQEEFDSQFIVAEFPPISDNLQTIAKTLFNLYSNEHRTIDSINDEILAEVGANCDFYSNPKYKNYRVKLIKENCQEYYNIMYAAQGKKVLDTETMQKIKDVVKALKESEATSWYFQPDSPFDSNIQRFYQLKFKATFDDINYRCMADEIIVDHENKIIYPIDLKTSGHPEWDFANSFVQWRYQIQARLYWRIIRKNLDAHPIFKNYMLKNYRFIVVNKETITPLVWEFGRTQENGQLEFGKNNQIVFNDPFYLGKSLKYYMDRHPRVPIGIKMNDINNLESKLCEL